MRVLVTGAGGQVGRALLASVPGGIEVFGLGHSDLDLASARAVEECLQRQMPDAVVNAAAYTAVDKAESEPDQAAAVNARGPAHLAAAARKVRARVIHLSTDFVFDGRASRPYRPDSATGPLSVYGRTKLDGERAVLAMYPERSLILRTAWIYDAAGKNFVCTMLRLMRAQGAVRVVSDQVGSPTAAQSVAEVIWRLIARGDTAGIHHWTDAGVASWYDLAVAVAEEAVRLGLLATEPTVTPIRTEDYPTPARRPAYSVLDTSSLASVAGPPVHWRKMLRRILEQIARAERATAESSGA